MHPAGISRPSGRPPSSSLLILLESLQGQSPSGRSAPGAETGEGSDGVSTRIHPFQSVPERYGKAAAPETSSRAAGSLIFSIYPRP
eukprot:1108967-Pyramimonas_sp.AAC.1